MLSGKYHGHRELSPSQEHYLRGIFEVRGRLGYARLTDVAREIGVSTATLSVGLKPLEARGLLHHDAARFLALTPAGERVAREVHHRFAVLRAFLRDVLGVDPERAEQEACLIEHDLGAETTERFVDFLKLLHEDPDLAQLLHRRLDHYRRTCQPSEACSTCGLACLTQAVG